MKTTTVALAELVEDMDIYPRHSVDSANVASLVAALETGATLPPIVADKKTKKITDGWHRGRAYRRVLGADATIEVELVKYKSKGDMIFDAVQRNAAHGRRLDKIDQTRSVLMLERARFSKEKISLAMNIPVEKVVKLKVKVATSDSPTADVVPGTTKVTLKRPVKHLQGTKLTDSQAEVHKMLPGTSFLLISKQLNRALREEMVDLTDKKLLVELAALRDTLIEVL